LGRSATEKKLTLLKRNNKTQHTYLQPHIPPNAATYTAYCSGSQTCFA